MTVKELLKECDFSYFLKDYKELLIKCDEVLKIDDKNPIALNYKAIAYYYLGMYDFALNLLNKTQKLYPENYYTLNNKALVFIALKEYEKALECCNRGLEIEDFDWLETNKIKALLYLDRVDEAKKFYNSLECHESTFVELLFECNKFSEVIDYYLKNPSVLIPMDMANALEEAELKLLADYYNGKLKENPTDIEVIDRLKTLMVKYDIDI